MAVQEQTPLQEYTANGITKQFDLEFDCESADHLIVSIDDLEVLHTDWYLSGNAIMFHIAPANGKQVKIQRNTPFNRLADYQSYNNSFRPPAINKDFDRIWWKLQELGVADWILSNRISALKAYVDDRDDELRAYLLGEIRKQGVALDQLDEYYNYLMERLAQIAVDKGWDASFVVDGDKNQHQINKDQKDLNNGYESIAEMLAIQNPANGMRVFVKSYHAGLKKGGGWYIFDESQSSNTDDILNINGWLLQHNNTLNLYNCGLKGDGVSDDRPALQKAIRVASRAKLNLMGNPSDTYLLNSLSSESGSVRLVWCNTSYVNLDLNGSTIKVANNLGDYQAVFAAGWVHTHFKITNGTIDQNTTNNLPQSPVLWSNTNGQRCIFNAYSVPHKYFEVTSIKMLDVLGVWEINTTQAEVVNICDNELYYSAVPITHTDKTAFYVLPRRSGKIKNNKLFGDTYGNATTAVEIHGSNCEFIGNTVVGFRSPLFISPSNREANSAVVSNIYVINNDFNACQSGVIIWVESAENLSKPLQNIHIIGNKVLIDSRLITNKDMGLLNGTGVGFLGADSDCEIDALYIKDNKINYLYNAENIGKDSPAAIDLISFMPNSAFKWSNIFIQNNTIENAPCNGIALGNTSASSHTSSISNVLVSGNSVIDCGAALFNANSHAFRVFNPSNMSKIRFTSNTLTETSNSVTYMKFINVDAGDGSAITGVRFYDNETSFHRSTSINEMYVAGGVMINDFRKNHLNNNDTNTKAKYGSTFTDLNTGNTIVQSSLNANTPVWKTITH